MACGYSMTYEEAHAIACTVVEIMCTVREARTVWYSPGDAGWQPALFVEVEIDETGLHDNNESLVRRIAGKCGLRHGGRGRAIGLSAYAMLNPARNSVTNAGENCMEAVVATALVKAALEIATIPHVHSVWYENYWWSGLCCEYFHHLIVVTTFDVAIAHQVRQIGDRHLPKRYFEASEYRCYIDVLELGIAFGPMAPLAKAYRLI